MGVTTDEAMAHIEQLDEDTKRADWETIASDTACIGRRQITLDAQARANSKVGAI